MAAIFRGAILQGLSSRGQFSGRYFYREAIFQEAICWGAIHREAIFQETILLVPFQLYCRNIYLLQLIFLFLNTRKLIFSDQRNVISSLIRLRSQTRLSLLPLLSTSSIECLQADYVISQAKHSGSDAPTLILGNKRKKVQTISEKSCLNFFFLSF